MVQTRANVIVLKYQDRHKFKRSLLSLGLSINPGSSKVTGYQRYVFSPWLYGFYIRDEIVRYVQASSNYNLPF